MSGYIPLTVVCNIALSIELYSLHLVDIALPYRDEG